MKLYVMSDDGTQWWDDLSKSGLVRKKVRKFLVQLNTRYGGSTELVKEGVKEGKLAKKLDNSALYHFPSNPSQELQHSTCLALLTSIPNTSKTHPRMKSFHMR
jgi:hypothetical protein